MQRIAAPIMMIALTLNAAPSWAKHNRHKVQEVERLSNKAAQAYQNKNFGQAIKLFKKAYAIEPVPLLLYNMGRCHEKLKDWDKAIASYKSYIVSPDVVPKERKEALERIAKLEAIKQAEAPIAHKHNKTKAQVPEPKTPIIPYVVLGTGLALVTAGGTMGFFSLGQHDAFENASNVDEKLAAQGAGRTMTLVADGLYVVGGITAIVGLFMVMSSAGDEVNKDKTSVSSAALTPWFGRGSGGVHMSWSF